MKAFSSKFKCRFINNIPNVFIIAITIPFDIRDVEYDKKKTYTIPMLVGDKMAKKIAVFFITFFLIIDSYLYLNNLNFGFLFQPFFVFYTRFILYVKDNQKKTVCIILLA